MEANSRITIPAVIATIVLFVGGFAVALAPSLVFHSRLVGSYGEYHTAGPIIGVLSLVPANVWAVSALWSRTENKPLLVVMLVVLTVIAATMLFLAFTFIYLSTVDSFVF